MIGTLRRECLDHLIILNEQHLRAILREFVASYPTTPYDTVDRPHRTLELEPPVSPESTTRAHAGRIRSRPVLGGLHHVSERAV